MKKLEKLTKEHALEMIQSIDHSKWDDEAAHYMEDELRADFIYTCSLWGYTRDEMIEIAGYCETILWKVSEFINPSIENLRSDMDFETWVMHYFTEWKFEVSAIFSDIAYVSVIHNK